MSRTLNTSPLWQILLLGQIVSLCMQTQRSGYAVSYQNWSPAGFRAGLQQHLPVLRSPPILLFMVRSDFFGFVKIFLNCSKAPKAKNPNPSGLGRAIINRRAKDARQTEGSGLVRSGRISIEGSQPCLLVHNRHRTVLSFAICHPGRRSGRILEYGTISGHRIYGR